MSSILDLPREAYAFLARPTPQTLLLRGPPGTGKTTLGLSLLQNYSGPRYLITSRVPLADLRRDFPYLDATSSLTLLDATADSDSLEDAARLLQKAGELVRRPEKEQILRGLWLPETVQAVLGSMGPADHAMLVIDSWDALVERYLGPRSPEPGGLPDRDELERLLLDQIARASIFLVLILERSTPTQLDYLVNGVLETHAEASNGRPQRWLSLRKLRGVRIDCPEYPFTLEDARFRCVSPLPDSFELGPIVTEPDPAPTPGTLWPGSSDFANAFGRLRAGRVTLLEMDGDVPYQTGRAIMRPIAASVLRTGGRLVLILPPNIPVSDVWTALHPIVSTAQFLDRVRLQTSGPSTEVPDEVAPAVLPPPSVDSASARPKTPEGVRWLNGVATPGSMNVSGVWVGALRAFAHSEGVTYSPDTLPGIVVAYLSGAPSHIVFIGPSDDALTHSIRSIAATRIRVSERSGRIFLFGEQPLTPPYVLSEGTSEKPYRLIRIV